LTILGVPLKFVRVVDTRETRRFLGAALREELLDAPAFRPRAEQMPAF
jgi:hypothetical protein